MLVGLMHLVCLAFTQLFLKFTLYQKSIVKSNTLSKKHQPQFFTERWIKIQFANGNKFDLKGDIEGGNLMNEM